MWPLLPSSAPRLYHRLTFDVERDGASPGGQKVGRAPLIQQTQRCRMGSSRIGRAS
jgi:hypothetical protein